PLLDRRRPLWKMVVVHGRADGNTAIFTMTHHAMVDGVSGVDLTLTLHDLTPTAPTASPSPSWQPRPLPDPMTLVQDAVRDSLVEAAQRWSEETFRPLRPAEVAARAQQATNAWLSTLPTMLLPAPVTPFNGRISTRRDVGWAAFPFPEIRAIRSVLGGTVNDVVLAIAPPPTPPSPPP